MRAWQCDQTRPLPGLRLVDREAPQPNAGELLIRVHAVGVTPTELLWYPTTHTKPGLGRPDAIPGHEFSGVVVAVGSNVRTSVGQEVFGMNDWFSDGACAEYCCTLPEMVIPKPACLTHIEAASVPIGSLTAWQGLIVRAGLQPGEFVLVHGGSGAVGVYAIQLARWRGARVVTTASARNEEFLKHIGAERVIDYRTESFDRLVSDVDVVFDTVGGQTLARSLDVLGPRGRLVTVATSSEGSNSARTKEAFFIVEPNGAQLAEIADLLATRQLEAFVDSTVPFGAIGPAFDGEIPGRLHRGKIVASVLQ